MAYSPKHHTPSSPAATLLTLTLAALIAYALTQVHVWLIVAMALAACGIFVPPLALLIHKGWFALARLLNRLTQPILLLLLYWLVLTPVALLFKLLGKKSPLPLQNNSSTTFVTRKNPITTESFKKMW